MMNSRTPAWNAAVVAVSDGPSFVLPLVQLFGSPSVASRMIGGLPAGGGFAVKSATAAVIALSVGVLPPLGGLFASSVEIADALLSARGVVKPLRFKHGVW